jgi:CheY-like chemotaxis protein
LDDDEVFRRALAETLQDDGYDVYAYADPALVPPVAELPDELLLITDYHMQSADGLTFADQFHQDRPHARAVLITSYSTPPLDAEVAGRPFMRLLPKPLEYGALLGLLPA